MPTTHAMKKYKFNWGKDATNALETLKYNPCNALVLSLSKFDKLSKVTCDATEEGSEVYS